MHRTAGSKSDFCLFTRVAKKKKRLEINDTDPTKVSLDLAVLADRVVELSLKLIDLRLKLLGLLVTVLGVCNLLLLCLSPGAPNVLVGKLLNLVQVRLKTFDDVILLADLNLERWPGQ